MSVIAARSRNSLPPSRGSTNEFEGLLKEVHGHEVQVVADLDGSEAREGAGVGAFEDQAEAVAGEHPVPGEVGEIAVRAVRVIVDQLARLLGFD